MILGLDFGSTTGWAIGDDSGTWDIAPKRGESSGMRYIKLRARLNEIRKAYPRLTICYYEMAHNRGGAATEYANGCTATLQAWCCEHGYHYASVHSATIKKEIAGHGKASKQDVINAVKARGYKPTDDNEADAIAIKLVMEGTL